MITLHEALAAATAMAHSDAITTEEAGERMLTLLGAEPDVFVTMLILFPSIRPAFSSLSRDSELLRGVQRHNSQNLKMGQGG